MSYGQQRDRREQREDAWHNGSVWRRAIGGAAGLFMTVAMLVALPFWIYAAIGWAVVMIGSLAYQPFK